MDYKNCVYVQHLQDGRVIKTALKPGASGFLEADTGHGVVASEMTVLQWKSMVEGPPKSKRRKRTKQPDDKEEEEGTGAEEEKEGGEETKEWGEETIEEEDEEEEEEGEGEGRQQKMVEEKKDAEEKDDEKEKEDEEEEVPKVHTVLWYKNSYTAGARSKLTKKQVFSFGGKRWASVDREVFEDIAKAAARQLDGGKLTPSEAKQWCLAQLQGL